MARSTPGTAGSKGGGSVIPSNQMRIGGGPQPIFNPRPSPYGPSPRFPRGGGFQNIISTPPFRRPPPFMPPPFRRPPPRRYPGPYMPSPQNRYLPSILPRQRSPFSPPPNRYGGVRGPSGLAGFLANQPAIRQIEIDPATGFRSQNQVERDAAEAAARAAAQAERDRIAQEAADAAQAEKDRLEQEANQQAPVPEADPLQRYREQIFEKIPEEIRYFSPAAARQSSAINLIEQPAAQGVDPTRSSGKVGSKGGASTVPAGSQTRQGMGGVSKGGGMGGTSMPSSSPDVQQQIMRQIQMEQAGARPNTRPTMRGGMATGGPVGIASLAGRY